MRWLIPIERYRIQCDVFQGMWLILCELCKRLEAFYKKSKVKRVVFRASLWQTQPKHKFKSFSRSIFHCSIFGYRTKHYLLFNNYIRSSCLDTSWSTALGVWYVTSQCWLTYIPLLGFWLSDKTFVLFDLLVLSVWRSDETLRLVFDNSRCLDIRWNTPSRVWYISYRCLDTRWNTPPCVWYICYRCLDIRWHAPFSCLIYNTYRCLGIRWSSASRVWYNITSRCF